MKKVITHPSIRHRSLRRDGFDRRVWVDAGYTREPSRIRDPHHAYLPAVVGKVLDQPFDGVVGVSRLIGPFVARVMLGAIHDEQSFGAVPPADILGHEDVAVLGQLEICAGQGVAPKRPCGTVGGPNEHDRERSSRASRE